MMRNIVGPQATAATVLFGEVLGGPEAERTGLVWRCVPDDDLVPLALDMAASAARAPRELVQRVKATIGDMASIAEHAHAVERELGDQVWSVTQPAFAERLAALQRKISSDSLSPVAAEPGPRCAGGAPAHRHRSSKPTSGPRSCSRWPSTTTGGSSPR